MDKIQSKILSLKVFAEPRPKYIAKVTLIDRFFEKTILRLIPHFVRPNIITILRFVSIPFVVILLLQENYGWGLWFFALSAFTDALDGALARTRNQITDWGIVFDPLADKLLIGSTAIIVISKLLNPYLAFIIVFIEVLLIISAYARFKGEVVPAKTAGKIKMILQSVGVGILLLSAVTGSALYLIIATYVLYAAIFFALLSLFVYRSI